MTYFGGERVVPGYNMMGVCKAALDAAVKYLAYDLGPKKIRVNGLSAGPVKTLAASAVGDSDKLAGLYELSSPLERNITREEVGAAGMFLLSDLASGITGEILHVDCGYNVMGSPGRAVETSQDAHPGEGQGGQPRAGGPARKGRRVQAAMSERTTEQPIPVGIGIIRRGDRFLVRQRPAGHRLRRLLGVSRRQVRAGRDARPQATARECLEETGLAVVGRSASARHDLPLSPRAGRAALPRLHDRRTRRASRSPGSGFQWVAADELASLRFPEANERSRELVAMRGYIVDEPDMPGRHPPSPTEPGLADSSGIGGSRSTTLSIRPYSRASSGDMNRSRSVSS